MASAIIVNRVKLSIFVLFDISAMPILQEVAVEIPPCLLVIVSHVALDELAQLLDFEFIQL